MVVGKLKIEYEKESNRISITGDAEGLRYLADVCTRIIDKTGPGSHFHMSQEMGNLDKGSVETIIGFFDQA